MARYISRRLLLSLVTLWLLATIVFIIANVLPNDVGRTILGPFAPQESVDALNQKLGTDRPLIVQYVDSMRRVVHPRLRRLVRHRPSRPATARGGDGPLGQAGRARPASDDPGRHRGGPLRGADDGTGWPIAASSCSA